MKEAIKEDELGERLQLEFNSECLYPACNGVCCLSHHHGSVQYYPYCVVCSLCVIQRT